MYLIRYILIFLHLSFYTLIINQKALYCKKFSLEDRLWTVEQFYNLIAGVMLAGRGFEPLTFGL